MSPSETDYPDFKRLFESSPGLFLVLKPDLSIAAVSDAYLEATLTRREEILGKGLFEVFPDNPDDPNATGVANLKASLHRVLAQKTPDAMAVQKYDIADPEDPGKPFQTKYWSPLNSPVLDDHGQLQYIIHKVEDITEFILLRNKGEEMETKAEQMEAEIFARAQQLQETNKKLREAEIAKDEFFANVSHELRTPISLIFGPLESLLSTNSVNLDAGQIRTLQLMHNNCVRLLQMVNGLLDFAKSQARQMRVNREPTNLHQLLSSILNDFESALNGKKVALIKDIKLNGEMVMMDRYLFERILFNLLSNAGKFTPENGKVMVSARLEDNILTLKISDTGIGIPEHDLENIFKKYHQSDSSSTRRFEGTGLGLAMVKEFAGLLEGDVNVTSTLGSGSTFTVTCLAPPAFTKEATPAETTFLGLPKYTVENLGLYSALATPENKKAKILVCEDNQELSAYIVSLIEPIAEIMTAYDGDEGIRLAQEWKPDLVLSDVMMPGKDGIEVCRTLKSSTETANISVVLLTALTHRDSLLLGWEAKADEYLFKPFHPQELVIRIRSLLSVIEERKKAARIIEERTLELIKILDNEKALNQMKSGFVSMAAHEFRTPLTSIVSSLGLLEEYMDSGNTEKRLRHIERIHSSVKNLTGILDTFLSLDQLEQRKIAIEKSAFEFNELAEITIEELEANKKPGQQIIYHHQGETTILQDPMILKNILLNLLSNAIKYSPENSEIRIESQVSNKQLQFSVQDQGIGIPAEDHDKIFGTYFRAKNAGHVQGTGLGLNIVKRYVELLGGKIHFQSSPGKGTTFSVDL